MGIMISAIKTLRGEGGSFSFPQPFSSRFHLQNQPHWRAVRGGGAEGGRQGRREGGKEGGKEGQISFYFPPWCLKSKIFCRVLNICFQTASSH